MPGRRRRTVELMVWAGTKLADLGEGQQQARVIVAAADERTAARLLGTTPETFRAGWTATANATFDAIAMARPGTFFARPLNSLSAGDFRPVEPKDLL